MGCVKKHLAQATILIHEYEKSFDELGRVYPFHKYYALGHLAEAEDEILKDDKELALKIRDLRIEWEQENYESVEWIIKEVEKKEKDREQHEE